jgi:hypothetical protein
MMNLARAAALPFLVCALAACQSQAEKQADAAADRIEQQAETSAAAAGSAVAALGLSEAQLLDADLVTANGTDLGDVQQIRRGADGAVSGLLIEIEKSNPDRYVVIPIAGLTTRPDGKDVDVQTTMTAAELAALPDATLEANVVAPTPAA